MVVDDFPTRLSLALESAPAGRYPEEGVLSLVAAGIASGDQRSIREAIATARSLGLEHGPLYEIVLQSYLFIGFPRMIIAAETLHSVWPSDRKGTEASSFAPAEASKWYDRGLVLCRQVYKSSYAPLQRKVTGMAPEVFDWMIFEGYGKVLSRPGLSTVRRELCIVAFLICENFPRQLHSHLKGALNVGAEPPLVEAIVNQFSELAPEGYRSAREILNRIGVE